MGVGRSSRTTQRARAWRWSAASGTYAPATRQVAGPRRPAQCRFPLVCTATAEPPLGRPPGPDTRWP